MSKENESTQSNEEVKGEEAREEENAQEASEPCGEDPSKVSEATGGSEPAEGGPAEPEEIRTPSVEEQLSAAREESRNNYERYLRAVADMENYRRRVLREKEELRKYSVSSIVEGLLPSLDNLRLGIESAKQHPEAKVMTEGFEMVFNQMKSALAEHGLEEIHPEGEHFDPHQHEATAQEPHVDIPEGHVTRVVRKGYSLNGRLLRPASVVVSSGSPQEASAEENSENEA